MERSFAVGADILDLDLWMTLDGVIVSRHDRDLATTTDGIGNIDEQSWVDLQQLDAAARWTGEPFDAPVRVPSLEQILTRFADAHIPLELKQVEPSTAVTLCDVLRRTGRAGDVYLSAKRRPGCVRGPRRLPRGAVGPTTYADLDRMGAADEGDAAWCAVSPIGQPPYREDRFDREQVQISHRRSMALFTRTVDDPEVMRFLAEVGVDGVYTRRPDVTRRVFDEWATARPVPIGTVSVPDES